MPVNLSFMFNTVTYCMAFTITDVEWSRCQTVNYRVKVREHEQHRMCVKTPPASVFSVSLRYATAVREGGGGWQTICSLD